GNELAEQRTTVVRQGGLGKESAAAEHPPLADEQHLHRGEIPGYGGGEHVHVALPRLDHLLRLELAQGDDLVPEVRRLLEMKLGGGAVHGLFQLADHQVALALEEQL